MIILIGGKAGCGKDTVGRIINNSIYSCSFAFAEKLKEIACDMGWDGVKDFRGRKLLQQLGQTGRSYNSNIWVDAVVYKINMSFFLDELRQVAVVTDFRFPNEYKRIVEKFPDQKIKTIKVTGRKDKKIGKLGNDISENALNDFVFDATIVNSGTLQDLEGEVKKLLKEWDLI